MAAYINFNYNSPHEDVENCLGFNPDGSINIRYTLESLKNLLQENLQIVNELIDNVDEIQSVTPIGYNRVELVTNTNSLLDKLLEKNIVTVVTNEEIEDQMDDLSDLNISDEETNNDRLNIINNLTNLNNAQILSIEKNSDTEQESDSDELIEDEKNATSIINKYSDFIQKSEDSDSNNNSDSEYSDAYSEEE